MGMVKRGEVWWVDLDPAVGVEIQTRRPCVIVSPPEIHDYLRIVSVAPLTSRSRPASYRIATQFNDRPGLILLEQTRSVDKSRLARLIGTLDSGELTAVLDRLRSMFEP